jgi:hypothetical protein
MVVHSPGSYAKAPGEYDDIVLAVKDHPDATEDIKATVGKGTGPVIEFTDYPLVINQTQTSHIMTAGELKARMTVQDPEDGNLLANPAPAGTSVTYSIRQGGDSGSSIANIDTRNIGVYKVIYNARDSHGNPAEERARAVVVTDGRYIVEVTDDGNDTNDLIIGARDFVIAREHVDGSETQARGRSYAEAFDGDGDAKAVTWTTRPGGYVANAPVANYSFTWQVAGYTDAKYRKTIIGHVTGATVVDPGTKDSQYGLIASDFLKTTAGAVAMLTSGRNISEELIDAANAQVIKLVASAPNATVGVVSNGDADTGPFSAAPNTYPIRFGITGHDANESKAIINGVVSNGEAPILTVSTPLEVWIGNTAGKPATAIDAATWNGSDNKYDVTVVDADEPTLTIADVTVKAGSDTVNTAKAGIYKLTYTVTDSMGNTVTARRVVVVNDGTYKVGMSRILKANSFEINVDSVVTSPTVMKDAQLKSLSDVTLYDGTTGDVIDDTSVGGDGGYTNIAADYDVTLRGVDIDKQNPGATVYVTKTVTGKVVGGEVIGGPGGPDDEGNLYYVYGNDIEITQAQAQALTTDAAKLTALGAYADQISPAGDITDAGAKIESVTPIVPVKNLENGNIGVYKVVVTDGEGNAKIELTIVVMGGGSRPTITAPNPVKIPVDPDNHGNLTQSDLMVPGVEANDAEDGPLTGAINVILPSAGIPADKAGVYQVTYIVRDNDDNEASITVAVVLDDGGFPIDTEYVLMARPFIISSSAVTTYDADNQILNLSGAQAWNTKGESATPYVNDTGAYSALKGDYFPVVGIQGYPLLSKKIQVTVVDDSVTTPMNGDQYSIQANTFRINLADAAALAGQSGTAYSSVFIARSAATGYLRTGTDLLSGGTVELVGNVVKKDNASKNFTTGGFAEGDVYLATFMVAEEPATRTTVEVLVSNGYAPTLDVPAVKQILVGEPFTEADYMSGVSASDVDYPAVTIPQSWISHDSPVDNMTEGIYMVTYSVHDDETNVTTKTGVVLVGPWEYDKYGILAHAFTKRLGEVTGTEAEAISFADARGVDLRPEIFNGTAWIPNPEYGNPVDVTVTNAGGYYSRALGNFPITFAVKAELTTTTTKVASVVRGGIPVINAPAYKNIQKGDPFPEGSRNDTSPSYMQGVYAIDAEDGTGTLPVYHNNTVAPGVEGEYRVTYNVTDSDRNSVTRDSMVFVGPWVIGPGYAIYAHEFSKNLGQVTGTNADMINSAGARAIDIRETLPNGNPNPNFGNPVTVVVSDPGGYQTRRVGTFNITFAVQAELTTTVTIPATVGAGNMPTLSVPDVKVVPYGAAFGEAQYMQGVSADDIEDGPITSRVVHDSPVNTAVEGYYAVLYNVTDSDNNTARRTGIVLVGDWVVGEGYAINAYDFTRRAGEVRGTDAEMLSAARVQALCVDSSNPNFGRIVQAVVQDDGGYSDRKAGAFPIRFAVQAAPGVVKTITATVTSGNAPVLTVPSVRTVPEGAGFSYMAGVSATDAEDGIITSKIIYNTPVNTNSVGAYKITYSVTDSDGNTTVKPGIALVGRGWVVSGGYALYAQDFARKLSEIAGTRAEAARLAKAMAVWVYDTSSPDYGKYVPITILDRGSYRKAPGNYSIVFAVAESRSITKTIIASISDDTPRTPAITNTTTTTPAPNVIVNTPEAAPPAEPTIIEVPTPVIQEVAPPTSDTPIEPTETPLAAPEPRGEWHLADLLIVILTMALGIYLMMYALRRKDEYDDETTSRGRQIRMWGQMGILLAIVSVIVLLLTQTFTGDMKIIDIWAVLFAAILGVEILAVVGVRSSKKDQPEEWEIEESNV